MSDFLFIDFNEGISEEFNTEKEALEFGTKHINSYLNDFGGWLEDSDMSRMNIYKKVFQNTQLNLKSRRDWELENDKEDWFNDKWSYICDYKLLPFNSTSKEMEQDKRIKELEGALVEADKGLESIAADHLELDIFYDYTAKSAIETIVNDTAIARETREKLKTILKGIKR